MSFLQSLFGPSKDEIWQQFADAVGGSFKERGFWNGSKVQVTHGPWTVVLDTYTVSNGKSAMSYTRMRAPYRNPDGFQFNIYREGIFSGLGKLLGMQDVTVGYPEFDEAFIIKGNDEAKLRRLFANERIRDLINAQPDIQFKVEPYDMACWGQGSVAGVDELHFHDGGIIKDVDRLKLLYDLFSETLDELCRMGVVSEEDPDVKL